jgi:ribosomal protein S11
MSRTFTIQSIYNSSRNKIRYDGGRFVSDTPAAAARKAFSHAARNMRKTGRISLEIHMRETTQGSLHKVYKYQVKRVSDRADIEHDGETVVYKFSTKVRAL